MNLTPRTDTEILAVAMDVLARDIQSEDGVANAAIAEAAMRLRELKKENAALRSIVSRTVAEIGNGSACAPECSVEFMEYVPGELKAVIGKLREDKVRLDSRRIRMNHFDEFGTLRPCVHQDIDLRAAIDAAREKSTP